MVWVSATTAVVGGWGEGLPLRGAVVRAVLRWVLLLRGWWHLHGQGRPATTAVAGGIVPKGVEWGWTRVRPVLQLVRRWMLLLLLLLLLLKLLRQLKYQVGGAGILQQLLQLRELLRVGLALLRRLRRRRRRRHRMRDQRRRTRRRGEGRGRGGHRRRCANGSPATGGRPRAAGRRVENGRNVGVVRSRRQHRCGLGLRCCRDGGGWHLDWDEGRIFLLPPPNPSPNTKPARPSPSERMQVGRTIMNGRMCARMEKDGLTPQNA